MLDLLLATLLGGALTIIGGIGGTLLLSRLEEERERKRQRERHATAVRIVALELPGLGAAHIMNATGAGLGQLSTAGYDAVALDLYSLLPEDLASDVAFVYMLVVKPASPAGSKLVAEKVTAVLNALKAYGEKELGLKFQVTGQSQRWVEPQPDAKAGASAPSDVS
jgi:hypothetical protein